MKLLYAIILSLIVLVSACAQQTQQPVQPQPQPIPLPQPSPTPQVQPAPEEVAEEVMEEKEESLEGKIEEEDTKKVMSAGEVRIFGKGGFEPLEITINSGEAVTWINDYEKDITFTMFKDGRWYLNSDVINPGESFEHEFAEAGEYEHWTLAFGPTGAKITVE